MGGMMLLGMLRLTAQICVSFKNQDQCGFSENRGSVVIEIEDNYSYANGESRDLFKDFILNVLNFIENQREVTMGVVVWCGNAGSRQILNAIGQYSDGDSLRSLPTIFEETECLPKRKYVIQNWGTVKNMEGELGLDHSDLQKNFAVHQEFSILSEGLVSILDKLFRGNSKNIVYLATEGIGELDQFKQRLVRNKFCLTENEVSLSSNDSSKLLIGGSDFLLAKLGALVGVDNPKVLIPTGHFDLDRVAPLPKLYVITNGIQQLDNEVINGYIDSVSSFADKSLMKKLVTSLLLATTFVNDGSSDSVAEIMKRGTKFKGFEISFEDSGKMWVTFKLAVFSSEGLLAMIELGNGVDLDGMLGSQNNPNKCFPGYIRVEDSTICYEECKKCKDFEIVKPGTEDCSVCADSDIPDPYFRNRCITVNLTNYLLEENPKRIIFYVMTADFCIFFIFGVILATKLRSKIFIYTDQMLSVNILLGKFAAYFSGVFTFHHLSDVYCGFYYFLPYMSLSLIYISIFVRVLKIYRNKLSIQIISKEEMAAAFTRDSVFSTICVYFLLLLQSIVTYLITFNFPPQYHIILRENAQKSRYPLCLKSNLRTGLVNLLTFWPLVCSLVLTYLKRKNGKNFNETKSTLATIVVLFVVWIMYIPSLGKSDPIFGIFIDYVLMTLHNSFCVSIIVGSKLYASFFVKEDNLSLQKYFLYRG